MYQPQVQERRKGDMSVGYKQSGDKDKEEYCPLDTFSKTVASGK